MYRIMLIAKEGDDIVNNLYRYFTISNTEGKLIPFEANSLEEVDVQVEKMINGDYRKKDLLVVQVSDFEVNADIYVETATEEETDTSTEGTGVVTE